MENKLPYRHSIRLENYDYSQYGAYFITICTYKKKEIFGKIVDGKMILNEYGEIVLKVWNTISEHFENIELDQFVIMPNHVHGIIIINEHVGAIHELPGQKAAELSTQKAAELSVQKAVGSSTQKSLNNACNRRVERRKMLLPKVVGFFKMNVSKLIHLKSTHNTVWHRNYYEHVICKEPELNKIREYIFNNPLKWELDRENPKNFQKGNALGSDLEF